MENTSKVTPEITSVQVAFTQSWNEHQHTRDQTWKGLQTVLALTLGLLVTAHLMDDRYATLMVSILAILSSFSGISLTLHHRQYQRKKFEQISNFEKALNIEEMIGVVSEPKTIKWYDSLSFLTSGNTPMFIIRLYITNILFCIFFSASAFWR